MSFRGSVLFIILVVTLGRLILAGIDFLIKRAAGRWDVEFKDVLKKY